MVWNKDKSVVIIDTVADLVELDKYLQDFSLLAIDTETNGVHRFRQVVGISLATSEDEGFYIPIQTWDNEAKTLNPFWDASAQISIRNILTHKRKYIGHNVQFDVGAIQNSFGINLLDSIFCDTMLLAHTAHSEERPHGLKPLATLLLDSEASNPQDEVSANIKEKGGKVTKSQFDMYMCDYPVLGKYAVYDVLYTFGLYNRLFPKLKEQNLEALWSNEVMPMLPVIYDLNHNGIKIDVPYFETLKQELSDSALAIEDEVYASIKEKIRPYEMAKIKEDLVLSSRSAFGRMMLAQKKAKIDPITKEFTLLENVDEDLYAFQCERKKRRFLFNLDSNDDKAHLIYDVFGFECEKKTDSGKRSVDAETLEKFKEKSPVIQMMLERATTQKLLSTYVEPLLAEHVEGIIYTNFKPTGTTSGRLSCGDPINLQTLPKNDVRIKRGIVAREGNIFISADYSSLEPRCFSAVANEPNLVKVYKDNLDLYSQAGIDIYGLKGVSAKKSDENYLGKVDPKMRDKMKVAVLARCYGASANRLATSMECSYEDAEEFCRRYDAAYPTLSKWIGSVKRDIKYIGSVTNIVGRKRRANLVHTLYKKWGVQNFDKKTIQSVYPKLRNYYPDYESANDLFYACKNNFDNAVNFSIQSLAAAICNKAMIDFRKAIADKGLPAKIVLQVHDSISVECKDEYKEEVSKILQECMEHNAVTKLISVPMIAEPVFCKTLEEDK